MSNPGASTDNHVFATATPVHIEVSPAVDSAERSTSRSSYGQILESSVLIGGASVFILLIGMVRTKLLALLLGPVGLGLMGTFTTIVDLVVSVAGLGISRSAVRRIAGVAETGDSERIAITVTVLRRYSLLLATLGAVVTVLLSSPIARLSFNDDGHAAAVALLSLAVFCKMIAECQCALMQGLRRIADFAKIGIFGAAFGTVAAVPLVYLMGTNGVAACVVCIAAATVLMSWRYSRKVGSKASAVSSHDLREETTALLQLGVAFMLSGLLTMGAAYVVRVILLRQAGLEAVGLFQAAWTLGGLYVSLVLQAMGADFYPRLVAVAKDPASSNRLINEQTQISVLLASAGVVATLVLAPYGLTLFYSDGFAAATETLRWVCLGMALRVVTWPMGYIVVARGEHRLFLVTELAWTVVNIGLSYVGVRLFGLPGTGIAYFLSYVFHAVLIYAIARRLNGYRMASMSLRMITSYSLLIGVCFAAFELLPPGWAWPLGGAALLAACAGSLRQLRRLVPAHVLPEALRWLLPVLGDGKLADRPSATRPILLRIRGVAARRWIADPARSERRDSSSAAHTGE